MKADLKQIKGASASIVILFSTLRPPLNFQ